MTLCNCGAPTERGQLMPAWNAVERLALKEERGDRRTLDNLPAVVVLLAVVVLGAGAFGFALSELTGDSGNDSGGSKGSSTPAGRQRRPRPTRARPNRRATACC